MKPKFKELLEQVGGHGTQALIHPDDVEQFAELIVRECCDIFVELRTRPADLAVKDIKKHFGIK